MLSFLTNKAVFEATSSQEVASLFMQHFFWLNSSIQIKSWQN